MLIRSDQSLLLLIDLQERLAPAIEAIDDVLRHNLWLVEIAQRYGCTAILMGARGMSALRGVLLGSVSQGVIQRAAVPVTIVKQASAEER